VILCSYKEIKIVAQRASKRTG